MMNVAGRLGRYAALAVGLLAAFLIGERIVSLDRSSGDALADNNPISPKTLPTFWGIFASEADSINAPRSDGSGRTVW
jgi:hypothetical protein